jgi:hypothetical protein
MHRKRVPNLRRFAVVMAILSAPAIGASLGACGTVLELAPEGSSGGEGGTDGGNGEGSALLDGSEIDLDAASACSITADRAKVSMGEVLLGTTQKQTVRLVTTSTDARPVNVTVIGGPDFTVSNALVVVAPMTGAGIDVTFAAGASASPPNATGQLSIQENGCAPISIALEATRSAAQFAVSPGVVDLGIARCGTKPNDAQLSIQSTLDGGTTFSAHLVDPSYFTLFPTTGSVPPGTTLLSIGAPASAPALHSTQIKLTIAAEGPERTIPVTVLSQGPVLSYAPSTVTFAKGTVSSTVMITNTGNEDVGLQFAHPSFTFTPAKAFGIPAGVTKMVTITPVTASPVTVTVTPQTSPALCAPAPLVLSKPL